MSEITLTRIKGVGYLLLSSGLLAWLRGYNKIGYILMLVTALFALGLIIYSYIPWRKELGNE